MTTPDDARGMFRALANQIPENMIATQLILTNLSGASSIRPKGAPDEIDVEALYALLMKQQLTLAYAVMLLDNRLEKLDGGAGIPDDRFEAIMSEFIELPRD